MPWCDECDVYLAPNAMAADGTCPTCDSDVDTADMKSINAPVDKPPWHFWVMLVALVAYLGWRLLQGVLWATGQV
ncbi:MAG: hypothetical protein AAGD35_11405 [Actinomycetota bacterium]